MRCINELSERDLRGVHVIVRAGFDVPLAAGEVADTFRLKRAVPTLDYLRTRGAKTTVISHIGRDGESLAPVARAMERFFKLTYIPDIVGRQSHDALLAMHDGDAMLLENLRMDPRESANDEEFGRELAGFGEIYVDDAFSVAHREHASIVGLPKLMPSYAGLCMCEEVEHLSAASKPPPRSLAIIGGAKFETKEPLITKLLDSYEYVFVCGALVNDIFRARGYATGRSLVSKDAPSEHVLRHPKLIVPLDVTVERSDGQARVKKPEEVLDDELIVDMGPESFAALAPHIETAELVLWNGPTGLYEEGYLHWTHAIAELIAGSPARSVIGGNNTLAAIRTSGIAEESFTFLSTGGGAMLEYLTKGTLPGIEAIENAQGVPGAAH